MSVELLPHNQKAYIEVKKIFKNANKAAVIHPTGTGKSLIGLKLIEENKDKKIIYLSSGAQIMSQLKKNMINYDVPHANVKTMLYQKLTKMNDSEIANLNADIIILDEFHHCGAPKWGECIQKLLNSNPNAKVLGLSATPMRYFDNRIRDMAQELFENNIASEMSLEKAISQGILNKPDYTVGLFEYEEITAQLQEKIDKCNNEQKRKIAKDQLDKLKEQLQEAVKGLPDLFEQSMTNKNGKYIVYCKDITDMKKKMEKAQEMFSKVNQNIEIMSISSDDKDIRKNAETITKFEQNNEENTLKLLFSVNMLNEGYHLKELDGVIMMRPTHSPTLFYQQLGRALSVGTCKKPIIIDLVNNIDQIRIIESFENKLQKNKRQNRNTESVTVNFSISRQIKDIKEVVDKITGLVTRNTISLDEKIKILEKFYQTGEELNGQTIYEGYPIGHWGIQIRSEVNGGKILTQEQQEKLERMGILTRKVNSIDNMIRELIAWRVKYPKIELNHINYEMLKEYTNSKEEYEKLVTELKKMQAYYIYIRGRKSRNKLTPKQELECKDGNIKGVFGYPTQIENLAKEYRLKESIIEEILTNYGTIDNFVKLYMKDKLNAQDSNLKRIIRNTIDIDLNPNSSNYDKLIEDILEEKGKLVMYSSNAVNEMLITLDAKERYCIEKLYGLLQENSIQSVEKIRRSLKVTKTRIQQIRHKALKKLRNKRILSKIILPNNITEVLGIKEIAQDYIDTIIKSNLVFIPSNQYSQEQINIDSEKIKQRSNLIRGLILENRNLNNIQKPLYYKKIAQDYKKIKNFIILNSTIQMNKIKNTELGEIGLSDEFIKEASEQGIHIIDDYYKAITKSKQDVMENKKIIDMDFSIRTYNCLDRCNIKTLQDLLQMTETELMNIRNLGKKSYEEIKEKLNQYGLTLKSKKTQTQQEEQEYVDTEIENLGFGIRTYNTLKRSNINTLGQLLQKTDEELKQIKHLGQISYMEIVDTLKRKGLKLGTGSNQIKYLIEYLDDKIKYNEQKEKENDTKIQSKNEIIQAYKNADNSIITSKNNKELRKILEQIAIGNAIDYNAISKDEQQQELIETFRKNILKLAQIDTKLSQTVSIYSEIQRKRLREERDAIQKKLQDYIDDRGENFEHTI